jgi:hypothetical protein
MLSPRKIAVLFLGVLIAVAGASRLAMAVDIAPVVDQGLLLGGLSQGKPLSSRDTAKALHGGELYQLCTLTRPLGKGRGSKPKPNPMGEVGPEFGVTFTPSPKTGESVVAVGGRWNAMPRLPRLVTGNRQPYVEAAKEILKSKGIAEPQVNLTQVIEIDLDGDGVNESLVCARRFTMPHESDVLKDGDYSMVFLHRPAKGTVRNILIEGQFQAASQPEPEPAQTWRVVGLADADGDGVMEIVVNYTCYEGGGARLYQLRGDEVDLLLGEDWGA